MLISKQMAKLNSTAQQSEQVGRLLSFLEVLLSDEFHLYGRTRSYWHSLPDSLSRQSLPIQKQYFELSSLVAETAELIRSLDNSQPTTLTEMLKRRRLTDRSRLPADSDETISRLVDEHQSVIEKLLGYLTAGDHSEVAQFIKCILIRHGRMVVQLRALD